MSIESECGSKRTYTSKAAAKSAEKHLRTLAGGIRQHTYRCSYCGMWHNGHGTARLDPSDLTRDVALRHRASDLDTMIRQEREALKTAQTPTQRRYYQDRITEFEMERTDTLLAINCATLEEAI